MPFSEQTKARRADTDATEARTATRCRLLMCRPSHFTVRYSINPWMHPGKPVDAELAVAQWNGLRALYEELGHSVEQIEPLAGLPDMVFAANGATVIDGKVLGARFRYAERAAEAGAYLDWLDAHGYRDQLLPEYINEGEGDYLLAGPRILAGTGFRTDGRSHAEAQEYFGLPVVGLSLVNPDFYHLDTALAVLDDSEIMYYPPAFAPSSQAVLRELYPDAILATDEDAAAFGLNAFSDGLNVVLPESAGHLMTALRERGFRPHGVDLSELLKAGGSAKCCTLLLRERPDSVGPPALSTRTHSGNG
ncbi:dimethylargininase [Streptomyces sp. NPDC048109]|uniref:dimethylargininase n=1 Tax=unclassified Streptomyces TaxID=2593676 RepID=UPI0033D1E8FB